MNKLLSSVFVRNINRNVTIPNGLLYFLSIRSQPFLSLNNGQI
ncbi:MAG: hypothetical protein SOR71_06385 [Oscillospiraceae bacterium]|nr:hypothetical protein [Oscillospiraceae bacterium]